MCIPGKCPGAAADLGPHLENHGSGVRKLDVTVTGLLYFPWTSISSLVTTPHSPKTMLCREWHEDGFVQTCCSEGFALPSDSLTLRLSLTCTH